MKKQATKRHIQSMLIQFKVWKSWNNEQKKAILKLSAANASHFASSFQSHSFLERTLSNACALSGSKPLLLSSGFLRMFPLKLLMKLHYHMREGNATLSCFKYFPAFSTSPFHSHLNEKLLDRGRKFIGPIYTTQRSTTLTVTHKTGFISW